MVCYPGQELLRGGLANHLGSQQWRASQTAKEPEHLCSVNEARDLSANKQDNVLHKTTHPKSYNTLQQSKKKKKNWGSAKSQMSFEQDKKLYTAFQNQAESNTL